MIIEGCLNVLYSVFGALTSAIDIPSMPPEVQSVLADFISWVTTGLSILATYTHLGYLLTLFGIVVSVDVGILVYNFVMWVLRKIPMLSIR